jgi:hypothetical protein
VPRVAPAVALLPPALELRVAVLLGLQPVVWLARRVATC